MKQKRTLIIAIIINIVFIIVGYVLFNADAFSICLKGSQSCWNLRFYYGAPLLYGLCPVLISFLIVFVLPLTIYKIWRFIILVLLPLSIFITATTPVEFHSFFICFSRQDSAEMCGYLLLIITTTLVIGFTLYSLHKRQEHTLTEPEK